MTIKEIAEVAGVSYPTVHRAVSKIYQGKMKDGKKTDLSYEEAVKVMKALRKKNFVSPIQNEQVSSQNENLELSDYELNRAFRLAMVNMNNLAQSLANKTDELDKRISNIEVQTEKRKALLPPPQIKPRDHINMIVREHAQKTGRKYRDVWSELYKQFSYRTNTDPRTCAKNRNMGILDYIEIEGFIETLEAIAIDVFKED
jgi:hypothetical protein